LQRRFDSRMSSFKNDYLGNGKLNDQHIAVRRVVWEKALEQHRSTGTPIEEAGEKVARELFPMLFTDSAVEAARRQRKKTLGAGPSKKPDEPTNPFDEFARKLDKLGVNR